MVDPDGSPMADRRGRCLPSRNVSTAVTAGFKCHRCETEASNPLDAIRSPRDTPIWKLEAVGLPVTGMVRSVKEVKSSIPMRWIVSVVSMQSIAA